jgi:hypothetical protein
MTDDTTSHLSPAAGEDVTRSVGSFYETLYHGGDLHPDARIVYCTSDPDGAREYGRVHTVTVQIARALIVEHRRGISWCDTLEQIAGGPWPALFERYDGIVYRWPASSHWRTGRPVPPHHWTISLQDTVSAVR